MLWILGANNIHISALLPPHALAPITQFLDRTPHFHPPRLHPAGTAAAAADANAQPLEARHQFSDKRGPLRGEAWREQRGPHTPACGCVHVLRAGALEGLARGERAAEG